MDVLDRAYLPFPHSLPEFQRLFPDDAACAAYLEKARWGDGFACPHCGTAGEPFHFENRPGVLRCARAHRRNSVGATDIPDASRLIRVPAMDARFRRICAVFAGGALPDRAWVRGRRPVALGPAGTAPERRHPGRGGRGNRNPRRDRRCLAGGGRRVITGRRRSSGPADQTPVRGRGGGEGERRGVRDRRRRLSCLRHRQRSQAAPGRADDGRGRPRGRRFPVPLQGRGLVPDELPAGLLPGLFDPRRRPGAAAGGRLGAALSARPPRARRRSPVRAHVLCRPARPPV